MKTTRQEKGAREGIVFMKSTRSFSGRQFQSSIDTSRARDLDLIDDQEVEV